MTLTPSDVKPLEKWEDMCWNTGGANEETLLVEASKVADEIDVKRKKLYYAIVNRNWLLVEQLESEIKTLVETLRGNYIKMNTNQPPAKWTITFGDEHHKYFKKVGNEQSYSERVDSSLVEQLQSEAHDEGYDEGFNEASKKVDSLIEEARADERKKIYEILDNKRVQIDWAVEQLATHLSKHYNEATNIMNIARHVSYVVHKLMDRVEQPVEQEVPTYCASCSPDCFKIDCECICHQEMETYNKRNVSVESSTNETKERK